VAVAKLIGFLLPLVVSLSAGAGTSFAKTSVTPGDLAATRAYLLAVHEFRQAVKGDGPLDEAAVHRLVAHVTSDCPSVLAGAPSNIATEEIAREVELEVVQALEQPQRKPTLVFADKVKRLHWSNAKLAYYIHGSAAEDRANAELVAPDICVDARAVAASGFTAVPVSTSRFALQDQLANSKVDIEAKLDEPGELAQVIWIMLKPYERPDERTLIPGQPSKGESEMHEGLMRLLLSAEAQIIHALGLPEAEPPQPLP
jgi:hypothetical protein